ncbi:6-phospho-3-hexuloisomerase [Macrococcoides caseolyticum]|uniref:6-phospho-3-hexuloisomerase n=1 Tax=Macrococcoides caseolyticum TaxID=69966 RepID=UPI000C331331|nr:6-phospho-3-hexuloisomerase [Macrococcus caseolyticus]PKE18477.1 6-phospho-3-hexuloisomerase [Macrococcus caseolyticus]PKF39884.1 6-phospho-3-hexuloisomerase [Macrococcus caseolyticus]QYA36391.1 6-phospho-3-hexuloisomerase [Macrococcus caseolyticus]
MHMHNRFELILNEIKQTLSHVDVAESEKFSKDLMDASSIFVAGKGRSGLVIKSFAMRLNQLGKKAYVVGETTTPSIQKNDVFVIASGSGSTAHLKLLAQTAKDNEAYVLLLSTKDESPIADIADLTIVLPAGTKYDAEGSKQPLGSLFEQSSQIYLDSIVLTIQEALNVDEETMQNNHANLE